MLKPSCLTERQFIHRAYAQLPLAGVKVERNSYGVLYFQWISPCPEIAALWVSVTPKEVVLSCAISHRHISMQHYSLRRSKKMPNIVAKRRTVRDAIREVALFLNSKIAATITYDETGAKHSSGWCPKDQLTSSFEYTKKVFGPEMTQRAWVWSGEVNVTNPDVRCG
jgi:hypothetical protein